MSGLVKVTATVDSLVAVTESTVAKPDAVTGAFSGSVSRRIEKATSWAVMGDPSQKVTPDLILKTKLVGSGWDHDSAIQG